MPRKVLEIDIEKSFVAIAKEHYGVLSDKYEVKGRKGRADRINYIPGNRVFFTEFKREGNMTSPHQDKSIKMFKRLGYNTYVCYSLDQAIKALETEINAHAEIIKKAT